MFKTMPSERKISDGIGAEVRTTRACVSHTPYAWILCRLWLAVVYFEFKYVFDVRKLQTLSIDSIRQVLVEYDICRNSAFKISLPT